MTLIDKTCSATRRCGIGLGAVLLLAATACDSSSGSDADGTFRSGEVIRIVLGSSPGGGFDTQARMLQPYLDDALDEAAGVDVRVVVENMPGAQHRIAAEHVYNSPADGTRMIFSSAQLLVTNDVVRDAEYDIKEMVPLATAGRSSRGVLVSKSVDWPGDTFADVLDRSATQDVLISHPGLDVDIALLSAILDDAGVDSKLSPVDVGNTTEQVASLLRHETEAAITTAASLKLAVDDNPDELRMVAVLSCERDELLPDVPTIVEQGLPKADEICATVGGDDRVFLASPGVPEERAQILRKALETALSNEEYLRQAATANLVGKWAGADDVTELVDTMVQTYETYRDRLSQ